MVRRPVSLMQLISQTGKERNMSKRIIMVLCIALLVVSFAAARVINISVGPSIGFFTGKAQFVEGQEGLTKVQGLAFGADVAFDLTFGEKAEIYIQNSFLFNTKCPYPDMAEGNKAMYNFATMDIKGHVGFEYAVLTTPVKLSVGGGVAYEIIAALLQNKNNTDTGRLDMVLNVGLGATVKVEYQLGKNFSAYAKAYVDYLPVTAAVTTAIPAPEGYEPKAFGGNYNNFSVDGSVGIIFHF